MLRSCRLVDTSVLAGSRRQPRAMGYKSRKELHKARFSMWLWTDSGKKLFWQLTTATQDTLKGLVLEIWDYLLLWVVRCLLGAPRKEYSQRGEWLMQFIAEWRCTRASSNRIQIHSWVASTCCSQTVKLMSCPVLSSPVSHGILWNSEWCWHQCSHCSLPR